MTVAEWTKIRRELKRDFERAGVTYCQICGSQGGVLGLSFAHRLKRRFIHDPIEKRMVALVCTYPCHEKLDLGPKDVMYETVTRLNQEVYAQLS